MARVFEARAFAICAEAVATSFHARSSMYQRTARADSKPAVLHATTITATSTRSAGRLDSPLCNVTQLFCSGKRQVARRGNAAVNLLRAATANGGRYERRTAPASDRDHTANSALQWFRLLIFTRVADKEKETPTRRGRTSSSA